ncbi:MAG: hypothetical protein RL375_3712 [Pseudomonadota bacterium]|jgi:hypothetical protein
MALKLIVPVSVALAIVGAVAWWLRDSPQLQGLTNPGVSQARKCITAAEVVYTNGPCPAGSKEQAVDGGAVTIVPAQRVVRLPAGADAAASRATVRDLLVPPDGIDLRERQMERAIGR